MSNDRIAAADLAAERDQVTMPADLDVDPGEIRRPDLAPADARESVWIELRQAHRAAHDLSRFADQKRVDRARAYRDGLITAYAILTAKSDAEVYEDLEFSIGD